LSEEFAAAMARLGRPWPGAVAVSGGADSVALMLLLAGWARQRKLPAPIVLTVDHGLHPDSAKHAQAVAKRAKAQGLAVHTLIWKGAKPRSDIEAAAREARYRLLGEWCAGHKVSALYVGHTRDDQAETFLLRLARGSGLDGLAAMRAIAPFPLAAFSAMRIVRPLLGLARQDLRAFLKAAGESWIEDPMNDEPRFARGRLRAAWPMLAELGLSPARVADAANHLARAREALELDTGMFLKRATQGIEGGVLLDGLRLKTVPREIGLRAFAHLLSRVSGEVYRPRFDSLERLFDSILAGTLAGGATLHGCKVAPAPRAQAVFGSATLLIAPESATRPARGKPKARG
jgi:tRNA(Ile)-lysidine synthase